MRAVVYEDVRTVGVHALPDATVEEDAPVSLVGLSLGHGALGQVAAFA
jgi:hypothetical protein